MKIRCMNCMEEYEDADAPCPKCGYVKGTPPNEIYHLFPEEELADRYIIGTVIAYGGFGILYRAWDNKLQIMVAIKEYFPSSYVNRNPGEREIFIYTSKKRGEFQEGLEGFLSEARNTAKFSSHPNIVNVYDYFKENGTAYMVMEYMDGKTLKEYTKEQGGRLPWEEAVRILTGICDDLQVVHEAGILHRDISPDNIMLCTDGSIKLFDFGAARFSDIEREMTRTIVLKIGFAPPEQYQAKSRQGPWTDVYALGATLYRTITGILPDESMNRREAMESEGADTLANAKASVPELPDYLDIAIEKAMAIEPELRFKTVLQFRDALLDKKSVLPPGEERKLRKRRQKQGLAATAALLLAGVCGCVYVYQSRQKASTLQGARVTIWAPVPDGTEIKEKQDMLEAMAEEFCADYPGVALSVSCIPEAEYQEALEEASASGTFPSLYECPRGGGFEERREELGGVLDLLGQEGSYFLSRGYLGEEIRALPLGMRLPVVYVNTLLEDEGKEPGPENDEAAFLAGESLILVSDTGTYEAVQEHLPGIYAVRELEGEAFKAVPDPLWSVDSGADELDKNAARRVLYYFLGETAQDIMHVQNECSLPLNKEELAAYLEINQELSFLGEALTPETALELRGEEACRETLKEAYQELKENEKALEALKTDETGR